MKKLKGRPRIENDDRGILHIRIDRNLQQEVQIEAVKKRKKMNQMVPILLKLGLQISAKNMN